MKTLKLVGAVSALSLSCLASAATSGNGMHVNVPFSFELAGENFSAGEYLVRQSDTGVILVQGAGKAAMALSIPSDMKTTEGSSVHFSKTAEGQRLAAVSMEGAPSRAIPVSSANHKRNVT